MPDGLVGYRLIRLGLQWEGGILGLAGVAMLGLGGVAMLGLAVCKVVQGQARRCWGRR